MAIEKDLRLATIQSGLQRSYKRLKVDTSKQESDKDFNSKVFDVNASLCELLFWINANDEWQCINNKVEYALYRKKGQPGANLFLASKKCSEWHLKMSLAKAPFSTYSILQ